MYFYIYCQTKTKTRQPYRRDRPKQAFPSFLFDRNHERQSIAAYPVTHNARLVSLNPGKVQIGQHRAGFHQVQVQLEGFFKFSRM
jgi:hypothetical protein